MVQRHQIIGKLLHREDMADYFQNIPEIDMKLWRPKIVEHLKKCMHPNCTELRIAAHNNSLFLEDVV